MKELTGRAIFLIVTAAFLLGMLIFGVRQCEQRRSLEAQSKVDEGQAGAARESGRDAVTTVTGAGKRETESEELTRANEREIRNAEGANERVGAGVDAAGRRALCMRDAYRNDPKCRVFNAPAR